MDTKSGVVRVAAEPGRYFVPSSVGPVLVDICALKGNGWCGCEDFYNRQHGRLERGEPGPHRCKHLRAARAWEVAESQVSEAALDQWVRVWNLGHPQQED